MAERASRWALLALLALACNQASARQEGEGAALAGGSAAAASCGSASAPCPMQRWMKANLQAFQRSRDYARLASALGQLALAEPSGYDGWAQSARQGAAAAARKDDAGVSQSCETCHKAHRDAYRKSLRAQALSF